MLYTDGAIERRGERLDVGLQRLKDVSAGADGLARGSSRHDVSGVLAEGAEDDTAMLGVRWRGIDREHARATVEPVRARAGTTVVHIVRRARHGQRPDVEGEIEAIIAAAPDRLAFDLSRVTFMDSSGIAMLLRVARAGPVRSRSASRRRRCSWSSERPDSPKSCTPAYERATTVPERCRLGPRGPPVRARRRWRACRPARPMPIAVMVSELAANAVRHTGSHFTVTVDRLPDRIRVEVGDSGPGDPVVRAPDPAELSGRGLQIVRALAADWGVIPPPACRARRSGSPSPSTLRSTRVRAPPPGSDNRLNVAISTPAKVAPLRRHAEVKAAPPIGHVICGLAADAIRRDYERQASRHSLRARLRRACCSPLSKAESSPATNALCD